VGGIVAHIRVLCRNFSRKTEDSFASSYNNWFAVKYLNTGHPAHEAGVAAT